MEKHSNFVMLSLVAIVAIVALVVLVIGSPSVPSEYQDVAGLAGGAPHIDFETDINGGAGGSTLSPQCGLPCTLNSPRLVGSLYVGLSGYCPADCPDCISGLWGKKYHQGTCSKYLS